MGQWYKKNVIVAEGNISGLFFYSCMKKFIFVPIYDRKRADLRLARQSE